MKAKAYIWLSIVALLALFPLLHAEGYYFRVLSMILLWVGLASAWNLTSGFTGYIDFRVSGLPRYRDLCHGPAYNSGGVNFFVSIFLSGIISGVIALFIGRYTMKLRAPTSGLRPSPLRKLQGRS